MVEITQQPQSWIGYPGKESGVSVGAIGEGFLDLLDLLPWSRVSGTGYTATGTNYFTASPDVELRENSSTIDTGNGICLFEMTLDFGGNPQAGEYFWFSVQNSNNEKIFYLDANVYLGEWGLSVNGQYTDFLDYTGEEFVGLKLSAFYDGFKITLTGTYGEDVQTVVGPSFTPVGDFPGVLQIQYYTNVDVSLYKMNFMVPNMVNRALDYEWYENDVVVSRGEPKYLLTPGLSDDGNQYYCKITDVDGTKISHTAILTVDGTYPVISEPVPIASMTDIDLAFSLSPDIAAIANTQGTSVTKSGSIAIANDDGVEYYLTDAEMIAKEANLTGISAEARYGPSYHRTRLFPVFTPVWP